MDNYKHLNLKDRTLIEYFLNEKKTANQIACSLKRHRSTILREIKKGWDRKEQRVFNGGVWLKTVRFYNPELANNKRNDAYNRVRKLKFEKDINLLNYIQTMVKEKFSPYEIVNLVDRKILTGDENITYREKFKLTSVPSLKTIYNYFRNERIQR